MAKKVCIVGAGPSGLVAAKTLLHNAAPGEFQVKVFDAQDRIGGLWPVSKADSMGLVHPLMLTNQSRHTMHFSDFAWEDSEPQFPQAWMVGRYLQRYAGRFLTGHADFELNLGKRITSARRPDGSSTGWDVTIESQGGSETTKFDHLIVASGFFGSPVVPEGLRGDGKIPVIHSSKYRELDGFLPKNARGGKILVVGGQMSGIEIAGTVAAHLSSAVNSPTESAIANIDKYKVHHVIQRPVWVFPLHTSPKPGSPAAPFLPVDLGSYNKNNRPQPLVNTQGHIAVDTAKTVHGIFKGTLGTDQSELSPLLRVDESNNDQQPYLAMSEWYGEFVRSGLVELSQGKVDSLDGTTAKVSGAGDIEDVAAVILATGFDASPCLRFLPQDILESLQHSPEHLDQPVALAFHGTHHPQVPVIGFVGFYRSPYWGVMQMQARFLASLWSDKDSPVGKNRSAPVWDKKLQDDVSIQRTLDLRKDPRVSQFPMGDYMYLMQELAEILSLEIQPPVEPPTPCLPHNDKPMDIITPSRYPDSQDNSEAKAAALQSLKAANQTAIDGLTTSRFLAHGVFRSLLGTWKLERDLISKLPSHPSGHFSGTAQFLLRDKTSDGLRCATNADSGVALDEDDFGMEYLYVEDGEFKTEQGFGFKATRRYVWRYDELKDVLSVWFAKPDDVKRADYLFHEIEFLGPEQATEKGWAAKAGHLCIDDYYDVKYNFAFQAVNLKDWGIEYTVKGPKKDYTIRGTYTR